MDVLSGTWQVSAQSNAGSSLEHWEIKFPNNNLEVIVFHEAVPGIPLPGDYRNRLEVSKVRMVGQKLSFALKRGPSWTAEYSLEVIGPERIEGLYSSTDTLLSDMGAIQGTVGSLRDKGRVIMIKQSR